MSQGKKYYFTKEQEHWLREHFPNTSNKECAEHLGITLDPLKRIIREMGLKKSREYIHDIMVKAGNASARAQKGTGYGTANLIPFIFKKGMRPVDRFGEEVEQRRVERIRKAANELIRKERMRIAWGLPQRTRRKFGCNEKKIAMRGRLKQKGYIVDRGLNECYYDDNTNRSALMEKHATAMGLTIAPCT